MHNQALDFIVSYLGADYLTETNERYYEALAAFAQSQGEPFSVSLQDMLAVLHSIPITVESHVGQQLSTFESGGDLTAQAVQQLQAIFDAIFSLEELGLNGLQTVQLQISALEENTNGATGYPAWQKDLILQAGAIARYSMAYWAEATSNTSHARHAEMIGPGSPGGSGAFRPWRWIRKAAVDTWAWIVEVVADPNNGTPTQMARKASNTFENNHP